MISPTVAKPVSEEELRRWGCDLRDSTVPLPQRFRALFGLGNASEDLSVDLMVEMLLEKQKNAALLKHEICYVLGQKGDARAYGPLVDVLMDEDEELIVRHEAGEALGALHLIKATPHLQKYRCSPYKVLAETCELAITLLQYHNGSKDDCNEELLQCSSFTSNDPAPPLPRKPVGELRKILLTPEEALFLRYRSLFTLRNLFGRDDVDELEKKEALSVLCAALACKSSDLFRHEVAFVLGQLAHPDSVESLASCLNDRTESAMVRHEAAEALGAIATPRCIVVLEQNLSDPEPLVSQSCLLGLDEIAYMNSDSLQYVNVPSTVS